jgi:hypothetical protein
VDLILRAAELQRQAHCIIRTLKLKERWEGVGKVTFSGSSVFGLMVQPNIDMEVYTDQPRPRSGFEVVGQIADIPGIRRVNFRNQLDDPEDPGLYWYVQYRDGLGQDWSIDTWLVPRDHPSEVRPHRFAAAMRQRLDDELRLRILEIKYRSHRNRLGARGIDIYKAVLRDGIETYEGLERWLEQNPPKKLEDWMPSGTG